MIEIKTMELSDIPFAVGLTNLEEWRNVKGDFERLTSLNHNGNFVAWENNLRIGMITTVIFEHLAFIGNLIVPRKYRGKGIGRMLLQHAVDYLDTLRIQTIEIDGDFPAVVLYRKLGFRDKYLSLRFFRESSKAFSGSGNNAGNIVDPGKIADLDTRLTGISREELIKKLVDSYQGQIYVKNNGDINAYSVVRKCHGGHYLIGPTMAEFAEDAEKLLGAIINDYHFSLLFAGVPEINRDAVRMMMDYGFQYNKPSLRMYRGKKLDYEKNIYSIIAGDVG